MSQLSARHLKKHYGRREIISDVSLDVGSGQVVGLLGPNGAGKTTCFYMIAGLVPADGGTILLDQIDISTLPLHRRARLGIGYLPQEASVFRRLSVRDNLMAILESRADLTRQQRKAAADELLQEFHIGHLAKNLGMSLSGGERRRVEIARALAMNPKFILLDEPFAGVDPISVGEIKHIIGHLKDRGLGILITDHNVRETLSICDKAYIVGEGTIIADGDAGTIMSNQRVREIYLGADFRL